MHTLILFLPLLALGLFLILPWQIALTLYIPILVGSIIAFRKVLAAQRRPRSNPPESMIGERALVIEAQEGQVLVDIHGEIWRAVSALPLQPRDEVVVKRVNGLLLTVAPARGLPGEETPP